MIDKMTEMVILVTGLFFMLRGIDLFCGIGGSSWGARQAGVQMVAGFDIWQQAGDVYKTNISEARFYQNDLSACSHAAILRLKEEIGEIDLLLASPECTSHSNARGNKPKDEKSLRLSWDVWRFARVFRPRWMVIENVPAMQKWSRYADFLRILREKGGYHCQEHILDASHFGVPQSRQRLYIVCDREREAPEEIAPLENRETPVIRDILKPNGTYPFSPLEKPGRAQKTLERAQHAIRVLGRETPFLIVYYGSEIKGGWQSLDEPLRTVTTHDRFALVKPDGRGGHEMRMLQPDELQAAMGFPPEYNLVCKTRSAKIHMLGNAVCPPVMQAIVKTLTQAR